MSQDTYTDDDIDALLELWDEVAPDPVDVFEDELATKLGLERGPGCSKGDWRRQRVRFINAATEGKSDEEAADE